MAEKIIGYILLVVGIGIIFVALYSSYLVFTKQMEPVELFHFPGISMDISKTISAGLPKELTQAGFSLPAQQQEIIPADLVNKPLNFFTYLMFMGFVVSAGAKIAGLGVSLLRPVTIKMPDNKTVQTKTN